MKAIIFLTLSIWLLSYSIFAEESKKATITQDKNVEIELLKERVKALNEKVSYQREVLKDEMILRSESLDKTIDAQYKSFEKLINVYATIFGLFLTISLTLLTFFGYRTIRRYIQMLIEPQAKVLVKKLMDDLKREGKETITNITTDLNKILDNRDASKPLTEDPRKKLVKFEAKLTKEKTEIEYLFDDWFYKGLYEYDNGNNPGAITYWSEALKLNPNSDLAYFNRGLAYSNLNQHEKAIKDYSKVIQLKPNYAPAYNNRGIVYKNVKQNESAMNDYNKAIELEPKNAPAYHNIASISYGLRQYKEAIKDYNKAIEADSNYSNAYCGRGDTYSKLNLFEKAINDYNKAIETNQNNYIAYNNRGAYYHRIEQDPEAAIQDFNKAIEIEPNYASAYCNRGVSYDKLGHDEEAIKDYNKAIELDSRYAIAFNNRGVHYGKLKQDEKAIKDYKKSIELDPIYESAHTNLAEALIITNDHQGALNSITKALSFSVETENIALLRYFDCITKKLLNMDTSECESLFSEIIKKDFTIISFSFDLLESWIKVVDISENTKKFVKEKTVLLKKHLKGH